MLDLADPSYPAPLPEPGQALASATRELQEALGELAQVALLSEDPRAIGAAGRVIAELAAQTQRARCAC